MGCLFSRGVKPYYYTHATSTPEYTVLRSRRVQWQLGEEDIPLFTPPPPAYETLPPQYNT